MLIVKNSTSFKFVHILQFNSFNFVVFSFIRRCQRLSHFWWIRCHCSWPAVHRAIGSTWRTWRFSAPAISPWKRSSECAAVQCQIEIDCNNLNIYSQIIVVNYWFCLSDWAKTTNRSRQKSLFHDWQFRHATPVRVCCLSFRPVVTAISMLFWRASLPKWRDEHPAHQRKTATICTLNHWSWNWTWRKCACISHVFSRTIAFWVSIDHISCYINDANLTVYFCLVFCSRSYKFVFEGKRFGGVACHATATTKEIGRHILRHC